MQVSEEVPADAQGQPLSQPGGVHVLGVGDPRLHECERYQQTAQSEDESDVPSQHAVVDEALSYQDGQNDEHRVDEYQQHLEEDASRETPQETGERAVPG
ncbi:hypothetical protein GCM10009603_05630 [Nocardiopsis exhalans]